MTDALIDTKDLSLTVTRQINAAPEAVFDAWLDPAMLMQFMKPGEGMSCPEAKADPVEGGRFALLMRAGSDDMPHGGSYVTIDRPKTLVFTWESPFSVEDSRVTLTFAPTDGGTFVTLRHTRFVSEESRDNHEAGWTAILATLEALL